MYPMRIFSDSDRTEFFAMCLLSEERFHFRKKQENSVFAKNSWQNAVFGWVGIEFFSLAKIRFPPAGCFTVLFHRHRAFLCIGHPVPCITMAFRISVQHAYQGIVFFDHGKDSRYFVAVPRRCIGGMDAQVFLTVRILEYHAMTAVILQAHGF